MTIDRNSWHYKLWYRTYWRNGETPNYYPNLCSYVQRIFWLGILYYIILALLALLVISMLSYTILYMGLYQHTKITLMIMGGAAALLGSIALFFHWRDAHCTQCRNPSIFKQWITAKKERVCPLIDFKN